MENAYEMINMSI